MTSKVKGTEGIEFPDSTVQGSAGISQVAADARYVNVAGDTMTGLLALDQGAQAINNASGYGFRVKRGSGDTATLQFTNAGGTVQDGTLGTIAGLSVILLRADNAQLILQGNNASFPHAFRDGGGNSIAGVQNSTGNWVPLSDRRAKENIVPMTKYGLDTILALEPVQYQMKSNGMDAIGFIAQDAAPILPESVSIPEDAESMWGMNQTAIVPVLVKAIQELSARVAELEERL